MNKLLKIKNITLSYNSHPVVKDISLELVKGKIGCFLGPSGCGKTTILRAIAGFESLREGEIYINDELVSKKGWTLSPDKRKIGIVFQDNSLFPHLTVAENIGFGLFKLNSKEKKIRVNELLCMIGLFDVGNNYPHELSGGQQQRVALARAMAPKPDLLLLDEPFSNLDGELRERLGSDVKLLLKDTGTTAILVTHDQHEAFSIADEIAVIHNGEIQQLDNAFNLYHSPSNRFVADFIGRGILFSGKKDKNSLKFEFGNIECDNLLNLNDNEKIDILIRPDDVEHVEENADFYAEIIQKAFKGSEVLFTCKLESGKKILTYIPSNHPHEVGEKIGLKIKMSNLIVLKS